MQMGPRKPPPCLVEGYRLTPKTNVLTNNGQCLTLSVVGQKQKDELIIYTLLFVIKL